MKTYFCVMLALLASQIVWPGGKLVVNCQFMGGTGSLGESWVKVAILDEAGSTLPDFSREKSDPLDGDYLEVQPTWSRKEQNLHSLIGKKIRLRFFLRHAEIFSFRSRDDSAPAR